MFWQAPGVWVTAVGYAGGSTPNPTYEEVCSGRTGHTEAVLVVYDPKLTSYEALLKLFWESHDPTQGMRQGNDVGTQYRSAIYTFSPEQRAAAEASREAYQLGSMRPGLARSPPRSATRRPSILPKAITSSIWQEPERVLRARRHRRRLPDARERSPPPSGNRQFRTPLKRGPGATRDRGA